MIDNQDEIISVKIERLRQVAKKRRLIDDSEFAKAIGISKSYFSEIINGQKSPKNLGQKLQDYLSVSKEWFNNGVGEMDLKVVDEQSDFIDQLKARIKEKDILLNERYERILELKKQITDLEARILVYESKKK